jgi:N-methylhydantoinase B/oxoprolinase/acetone carboxylase alpha subunit
MIHTWGFLRVEDGGATSRSENDFVVSNGPSPETRSHSKNVFLLALEPRWPGKSAITCSSVIGRQDENANGYVVLYVPFVGDSLVIELPGGGGFGDPRQRSKALVEADVKAGVLSAESAKKDYFFAVSIL